MSLSKEEKETEELQRTVDRLNEFRNNEKKLFSAQECEDGSIKTIFVRLDGNFELHHGDEVIDRDQQPAPIVEKFLEIK